MDWLIDIFSAEKQDTVAHIMLLYSIVIALGIYLGKIKIGGISLGVTFVLFVGILAGHIKFTGPIPVLTFCTRLWIDSFRLYDWSASRTGLL